MRPEDAAWLKKHFDRLYEQQDRIEQKLDAILDFVRDISHQEEHEGL